MDLNIGCGICEGEPDGGERIDLDIDIGKADWFHENIDDDLGGGGGICEGEPPHNNDDIDDDLDVDIGKASVSINSDS